MRYSIPSMLVTTDAIILSLQPYSDKAHLLHAYTRAHGRVNYMVYGLGRKHAIGLYTPFTVVQLTADYPSASSSKPPTLKEATRIGSNVGMNGGTDAIRQSIALFLSEVLYHTLRHPMSDEPLFDFIASYAQLLWQTDADEKTVELSNLHIRFLIGFAAQLGFSIDEKEQPQLVRPPLSRPARQKQLRALCGYFADHVETWVEPRSLDILTEIFD